MTFSLVWPILGTLLVAFTVYDFYVTTVTLKGGGALSKWFSRTLWNGFLWLHQRSGGSRILSSAGPIILLTMILMWFGLCWLGWFLIFCGTDTTIVNAQTLVPASGIERFYYAGFTLTTVGYGDFSAPNPIGQVASIISGFNGLFLVTLAITYSIPVVSASAERRQLALLIHSIGSTTPEMLDRSYGDGSFQFLSSNLQQLTSTIASVSQKHLAFPIIHYFHDDRPSYALPLNLARLDESITIAVFAFPDMPTSVRAQLKSTQHIISEFLQNLKTRAEAAEKRIPDVPRCVEIEAVHKSDKNAQQVEAFLASQERRQLLRSYVESDGWSWGDVHKT